MDDKRDSPRPGTTAELIAAADAARKVTRVALEHARDLHALAAVGAARRRAERGGGPAPVGTSLADVARLRREIAHLREREQRYGRRGAGPMDDAWCRCAEPPVLTALAGWREDAGHPGVRLPVHACPSCGSNDAGGQPWVRTEEEGAPR